MRRTLLLALAVAACATLAAAQDATSADVKFIPRTPGTRVGPHGRAVVVGPNDIEPAYKFADGGAAPEAAEDGAELEAAGDAAPGAPVQQQLPPGVAPPPGMAVPPPGVALPPGMAMPGAGGMPAGVAPPPGVEFMPNGAIKKPLEPPAKVSLHDQLKKPGVVIAMLAVIAAVGGLIVGTGLAIHHRWFKKDRRRTPGSTPTAAAAAGGAGAALLAGGSSAGTTTASEV